MQNPRSNELNFDEICALRDFWEKECQEVRPFYGKEFSEQRFRYYEDWIDSLISIAEDTPF